MLWLYFSTDVRWTKDLGHYQQGHGAHSAPLPTGSSWRMWLPFSTKHSSARITSSKLTTEPQRNTLPLCVSDKQNERNEKKRGDLSGERRPAVEISGPLLVPCFGRNLPVFLSLSFLLSEWWKPAPRGGCRRQLCEGTAWLSSGELRPLFFFFWCVLGDFYSDKMQTNLGWFGFRRSMRQSVRDRIHRTRTRRAVELQFLKCEGTWNERFWSLCIEGTKRVASTKAVSS